MLLPIFIIAITDPLYLQPWSMSGKDSAVELFEGDSLNNVVKTIQAVTHPTGENPKLHDLSIDMDGDILSAKISVDWVGGILGGHYRTVVLWRCDKKRDLGITVVSDNAPFSIENKNFQLLKDYFHDQVYANVIKNAHMTYHPFRRFER